MNAVFFHELKLYLRDTRLQLFLVTALMGLGMLLFLLWPQSGVFSVISASGRHIFTVILLMNLAVALAFVPAICATAVSDEKENNRFVMLLTTPLLPREIMWGKLLAAMTVLFALICILLPVSGLCLLSGGLTSSLFFKCQLVIMVSAMSYGSVCLAVSACNKKNNTALIFSYLIIAVLAGAVWLPDLLISSTGSVKEGFLAIRSLSPFDALYQLIYPEHRMLLGGGTGTSNLITFILINIGIFVVSCGVFSWRFFSERKVKATTQVLVAKRDMKSRLLYLFDPSVRKRSISLLLNPIFMAELRSKTLGNPRFLFWTLGCCNAASIVLLIIMSGGYATHLGPNAVQVSAVIYQIGLALLIAPGVCSSSITEDKNTGNLLFIRMSRVGAFRYVLGKIYASLIYVVFILSCCLPIIVSLNFLDIRGGGSVVPMTLLLLAGALLYVSCGVFFSAMAQTSAGATAASYIVAFATTVGSFIVLLFRGRIGDEAARFILSINPVAGGLSSTGYVFQEFLNRDFWMKNFIVLLSVAGIMIVLTTIRVHVLMNRRS